MKILHLFYVLLECSGVTLRDAISIGSRARIQAVESLLEGKSLKHIQDVIDKESKSIHDFKDLKLPPEVETMLNKTGTVQGDGHTLLHKVTISEADRARAMAVLNQLKLSAFAELDRETMSCKQFKVNNLAELKMVRTDLRRLDQECTDYDAIKQTAGAEILAGDECVQQIEETRSVEKREWEDRRRKFKRDLRAARDDIRVGRFMLQFTKCKKNSLLQLESSIGVLRCHEQIGLKQDVSVTFENRTMHLALMSMNEKARKAVQRVLSSSLSQKPRRRHHKSKKQGEVQESESDAAPSETAGGTSPKKRHVEQAFLGQDTIRDDQGQWGPRRGRNKKKPGKPKGNVASRRKQGRKCTIGRPICAGLHDRMSITWGKMKDTLDKLLADFRAAKKEWDSKNTNWNTQIRLCVNSRQKAQARLSQATGDQKLCEGEQERKQEQERHLNRQRRIRMKACKRKINGIVFRQLCGYTQATGQIGEQGGKQPEDRDCVVADWVAGECSKPCNKGRMVLTRSVTLTNKGLGMECPSLTWKIDCNKIPCPVDCKMGDWTGWSKCTSDCGGGVRSKSRDRIVKPKDGGAACDAPTEEERCNTASCDRDCELKPWTKRPCSVACGGGEIVEKRHIKIDKKGGGKCPKKSSSLRFRKITCNTHRCKGDEECIAIQDVVVLLDGSGSITRDGFDVLKEFAANVTKKFRGEAELSKYEEEQVGPRPKLPYPRRNRVGVVQFGNGELLRRTSGTGRGRREFFTVSPAVKAKRKLVTPEEAARKIETLPWLKGFTNMAQGFEAAKSVLESGRKSAQSVILCFTDGEPSFKFETNNVIDALRRTGVKIVMVVVKQVLKGSTKKFARGAVSQPKSTNFMWIPGLRKLKENYEYWINKVVVHSCPRTVSKRTSIALRHRQEDRDKFAKMVEPKEDDDLKVASEEPKPA